MIPQNRFPRKVTLYFFYRKAAKSCVTGGTTAGKRRAKRKETPTELEIIEGIRNPQFHQKYLPIFYKVWQGFFEEREVLRFGSGRCP
jgi:hypothetical protein